MFICVTEKSLMWSKSALELSFHIRFHPVANVTMVSEFGLSLGFSLVKKIEHRLFEDLFFLLEIL